MSTPLFGAVVAFTTAALIPLIPLVYVLWTQVLAYPARQLSREFLALFHGAAEELSLADRAAYLYVENLLWVEVEPTEMPY